MVCSHQTLLNTLIVLQEYRPLFTSSSEENYWLKRSSCCVVDVVEKPEKPASPHRVMRSAQAQLFELEHQAKWRQGQCTREQTQGNTTFPKAVGPARVWPQWTSQHSAKEMEIGLENRYNRYPSEWLPNEQQVLGGIGGGNRDQKSRPVSYTHCQGEEQNRDNTHKLNYKTKVTQKVPEIYNPNKY